MAVFLLDEEQIPQTRIALYPRPIPALRHILGIRWGDLCETNDVSLCSVICEKTYMPYRWVRLDLPNSSVEWDHGPIMLNQKLMCSCYHNKMAGNDQISDGSFVRVCKKSQTLDFQKIVRKQSVDWVFHVTPGIGLRQNAVGEGI